MANIYSVIIDADVARSSGTSIHPVSSGSRALLDSVKSNRHKATMCKTLLAEWKHQRSLYASTWLSSMYSRKLVNRIEPKSITKLLIQNNLTNDKSIDTALKDAHIIDVAIEANGIIASNDDKARKVFCELGRSCGNLQSIIWFNPIRDKIPVANYLSSGCDASPQYYLILETTA